MKSNRPRWLKWVLWTPIALAVLGFGAMVVAERRIDSEIEREVAELLKMGVDVRPITPERDAGPDYARLVETLRHEKNSPTISEETLAVFEAATQKPFASLTLSGAFFEGFELEYPSWMEAMHKNALAMRDLANLCRLAEIAKAVEAQVTGGNFRRLTLVERFEFHDTDDLQVLAWYRKELEKFDYARLFRAQLSSLGRGLRYHHGGQYGFPPGAYLARNPASPSKSWWEKALESQVLFRKASELAALRSVRTVSKAIFNMPPQKAANMDMELMVASELDLQNTRQASAAREKLDPWPTDRALEINQRLITIDLLESRAKNRPLIPTWSEKYCFDPRDGSPLRVKARESDLMIVGENCSFSTSW